LSVNECAPADVGWFSHESPFEFDIRRFRYSPGAARFWGGTPSVAPYVIARAGADAIAGAGPAAIEARAQALIDSLLARVPAETVLSHARRGERGAAVIIAPRRSAEARAALNEEGIAHDERMGGFRFSVHLYTEEWEIDRLAGALAGFC
jgi:selenocysteine lyase/cysteine desulfurase